MPNANKESATENQSGKLSKSLIEAKLKLAKKYGLKKEDLVGMLRNVYLSRKLDDTEISMKKQTKAYFQISSAGHEGILTAEEIEAVATYVSEKSN